MSEIISKLFTARTGSDYDDFFVVSKAEALEQLQNAEYFVGQVKLYLDSLD